MQCFEIKLMSFSIYDILKNCDSTLKYDSVFTNDVLNMLAVDAFATLIDID